MIISTWFSVLDEPALGGAVVRVLFVETENPTVKKSVDGNEHPLDWVGTRRMIENEVEKRRARGETINLVRVVGVREGNHVTEWAV
jgi:hypothetical protein